MRKPKGRQPQGSDLVRSALRELVLEPDAEATASRPHDAIDSWDDLSRGTDPTADPTAGPR